MTTSEVLPSPTLGLGGVSTPPALSLPVIMLIEDHDDISQLLTLIFTQAGYVVRHFATATEALNALRHPMYAGEDWSDVILTDLGLPGAKEPTDYIKELRLYAKDIPIIVNSAYTDLVTERDLLSAGADITLNKNGNVDVLKSAVRQAVMHGRRAFLNNQPVY